MLCSSHICPLSLGSHFSPLDDYPQVLWCFSFQVGFFLISPYSCVSNFLRQIYNHITSLIKICGSSLLTKGGSDTLVGEKRLQNSRPHPGFLTWFSFTPTYIMASSTTTILFPLTGVFFLSIFTYKSISLTFFSIIPLFHSSRKCDLICCIFHTS